MFIVVLEVELGAGGGLVVDGEAETEWVGGAAVAEMGGEGEWEREELWGEFETGECGVG